MNSLTSNAGMFALREIDRRIGLTEAVANQIFDERDRRYTRHTMLELLQQRVYAIATGYEDANEAAAMREDPVLKMVAERLPGTKALASRPTLSRFENTPSWKDLSGIMRVLLDWFVASYAGAPEVHNTVSGRNQLVTVETDDRSGHIVAGQILSSSTTPAVSRIIKSFLAEAMADPNWLFASSRGRRHDSVRQPLWKPALLL